MTSPAANRRDLGPDNLAPAEPELRTFVDPFVVPNRPPGPRTGVSDTDAGNF